MAILRPENAFLAQVIDAHGGMERWNQREKIEATIVTGGGFFPLKGVLQDSDPRRMSVWLHEERSSVLPYGRPISARCSRQTGSSSKSLTEPWSHSGAIQKTRLPVIR